jgi:hypothetical protein
MLGVGLSIVSTARCHGLVGFDLRRDGEAFALAFGRYTGVEGRKLRVNRLSHDMAHDVSSAQSYLFPS